MSTYLAVYLGLFSLCDSRVKCFSPDLGFPQDFFPDLGFHNFPEIRVFPKICFSPRTKESSHCTADSNDDPDSMFILLL